MPGRFGDSIIFIITTATDSSDMSRAELSRAQTHTQAHDKLLCTDRSTVSNERLNATEKLSASLSHSHFQVCNTQVAFHLRSPTRLCALSALSFSLCSSRKTKFAFVFTLSLSVADCKQLNG